MNLSTLDDFAVTPFPASWPADHLTFSTPADDVVGALLDVVGAVTNEQVLAMYSYTHPQLVAAVVAKIEAGVTSLVVLDSEEYANEEERRILAPLMALRGRPNLRLSVGTSEAGPGNIMHRKVYIADSLYVVTGSFNWTEAATREDNQASIGQWPDDAARLTASIEATYAYQMAHCPQPQ